ncbi:MAG: HD domain-containing protein [Phycisphaerales bacterium]|nr:HD domain-containing protein [Phycisphaerales bacterium]
MTTEKIIRDPVHDVIAFRLDDPTESLLFGLLNTEEFQRLRRIRQLGMASLAYPGADHSRYSHSLGVMQTARLILGQLRHFTPIDPESQTLCLVGSLLHDLGHGPFSHVFERVSGLSHEQLTTQIIQDPSSQVHQLLRQRDAMLPARVADLMNGRPERSFYSDILCGQLDADRFDYLLRDNLMTGSRYGGFDLQWLLHALMVDGPTNRLAVRWKGVSAVEAYLQSRYHMYRNVYFHKVVRSAEGMVKLALQRAKRLAVQDRLEWPAREHVVHRALLSQRLSVEEFTELDDVSILHCFKIWKDSSDVVLAGLCRGLLHRRLYKTVDLTAIEDPQRIESALEKAADAVTKAGGDAAYDLFFDQPADTPYETRRPADSAEDDILVGDPAGRLIPFGAISPLSAALNRQLTFRRLHVAEPFRDGVLQAVRSV